MWRRKCWCNKPFFRPEVKFIVKFRRLAVLLNFAYRWRCYRRHIVPGLLTMAARSVIGNRKRGQIVTTSVVFWRFSIGWKIERYKLLTNRKMLEKDRTVLTICCRFVSVLSLPLTSNDSIQVEISIISLVLRNIV